MSQSTTRVLGRLLVDAGVLDESKLTGALEEQRTTRERLGEILVRRGVDAEHIARGLAEQLRLPYAAAPLDPQPAALRLVERELALRLRVIPLSIHEQALRVAMADPLDVAAVDDIRFQTGRRIDPAVAVPAVVERTALSVYGDDAMRAVLTRLASESSTMRGEGVGGEDVDALRRASEAPPIVALVDLVLERAVGARASDIHIEPGRGRVDVRVRVDGALRSLMELPGGAGAAVVSRIKIMAGLDIAVKRHPQDGRGSVRVDRREFGLRISTIPTSRGEKVVIRLLDPTDAGRRFSGLGLSPDVHEGIRRLLDRGHGVLLVTGPTGSGKTTTLYAALGAVDRDRRNVITLENPIEYRLPRLTQVPVRPRAGLGFPTALRAVLRQDPDVVMVGEMRDRETVEVGMAAAMTGHLVLSTLHTNDAPGAVARLVQMGAPPYLVAGGLIGVVGQRLARRLCPHCRAARDAAPDELRALGLPAEPVRTYAARGCDRCDGTGYRGRVAIAELLVVDARTRELILRRAASDALREAAGAAGMRPLSHDAWQKVVAGVTTLNEVRPLLTLLADEAPVCRRCGGPIRSSFRVCPACGAPLRSRCACGTPLERGWRRCPDCGARTPDPRAPDSVPDTTKADP